MIRFFVVLLPVLLLASSIDVKIAKTAKELDGYSKNYKRLNSQMAKTAEAIIAQKKQIKKQERIIKELEKELAEKSSSYKMNKKNLMSFKLK